MAACLLLSWVGAARLVQQQAFPGPPEAVVLAPSSAVHDEPHDSTAVEFELRAGQIVHVDEESDRWLRIQHPAGRGWVRGEELGRVD